MNWTTARARIANRPAASKAARSKRESLLKIFTKAEAWGLDPQYAAVANITNLNAIIGEAKRAIRWENQEYLSELFRVASKLSYTDLLLALHIPELEEIIANLGNDGKVHLALTAEQFEKIKSTTKRQIKFVVNAMDDLGGFARSISELRGV